MSNLHKFCGDACIGDHKYKSQGLQLFGRITPLASPQDLIIFGCSHCGALIWLEKDDNYPNIFCASLECRERASSGGV